MNDQLLEYYERELVFLRKMGAEFAQKYPKVASRLMLRPNHCDDPHVERLIEAFSFLAARVHLKIDDEFPEITESLLNLLYPHYLAAIPSMSIAQFALDPQQGKMTGCYRIGRGTTLYSRLIHGTHCRYRTAYPVELWPIDVTGATIETRDPVDTRGRWNRAELRLSLRCQNGVKLSDLASGESARQEPIQSLRFFLNSEPGTAHYLYETIFNHATAVRLCEVPAGHNAGPSGAGGAPRAVVLPPDCLRPVGFGRDEGLLPYTARSFIGYRLLSEYFTYPAKFLFFDVTGLEEAARAGFGERFDIVVELSNVAPPGAPLGPSHFQLGCTPVVNLFTKIAEPIHLHQQQHEYHVIPDIHRQAATEIYSVDEVTTARPYQQSARTFEPFYSFAHSSAGADSTFWYATRRMSTKPDDHGTEVYLSLVDLDFDPSVPAHETITVHTTCTNRDLPGQLTVGHRDGDFELEASAPVLPVRCMRKPTETVRPPLRRGAQWRLISHLALNHLSLVENNQTGAPEALQEILLLYDFLDSLATRKKIAGITGVTSRRVVRRMGSRIGAGIVRGIETTVEFDEDAYAGSGVYLFASVLERFLALYVSINSFSQLVARTKQREGELKRWQPRAGEQILL